MPPKPPHLRKHKHPRHKSPGNPPRHPPKPPHLHHPPSPPHERSKKIDYGLLGKSVLLSTAFSALLGMVLAYFNVGLNVILPVLAPVWVGGITLWYSNHNKP